MGSVIFDTFKQIVDNSNYLPSANNGEENDSNKNISATVVDDRFTSHRYNNTKPNNISYNDMIFLFAMLTAFLGACCLLMSCINHYLVKTVIKLRQERRARERNEEGISQVSVTETSKNFYDPNIKKTYLDNVD